MAVKPCYGIKTPMLSTALDTEITLQKDGVGLKPLPIKFVIITIISGSIAIKVMMSNPVDSGTTLQKCIFMVLWVFITILLFGQDKTQQMRVQLLASLLNYLGVKSNRKMTTAEEDTAEPMIDMTNLAYIEDDGMIRFADKDLGYMFRITGTASVLLFDEDKKRIVDAVDAFYRKPDPDLEFIYITLKEAQKVHNQTAAVRKRSQKCKLAREAQVKDLCNNQLLMLREVVGKKYQSIHQYLILKARTEEALTAGKILLQNELGQSGMVIKRCIMLRRTEILEVYKNIYAVYRVDEDAEILKRNGIDRKITKKAKDVMVRNGKSTGAVPAR